MNGRVSAGNLPPLIKKTGSHRTPNNATKMIAGGATREYPNRRDSTGWLVTGSNRTANTIKIILAGSTHFTDLATRRDISIILHGKPLN